MDSMELRLGVGFKLRLLIVGLFSLGFAALAGLIRARRWPRIIDSDGLTLRNGTRLPWSQLTKIVAVIAVDRRGFPIPSGGHWQLTFTDVDVALNPSNFKGGHDALQLITRITGRSPKTG